MVAGERRPIKMREEHVVGGDIQGEGGRVKVPQHLLEVATVDHLRHQLAAAVGSPFWARCGGGGARRQVDPMAVLEDSGQSRGHATDVQGGQKQNHLTKKEYM